jgi:hypothetical protein
LLLLALIHERRGREILRTSPLRSSRKFARTSITRGMKHKKRAGVLVPALAVAF